MKIFIFDYLLFVIAPLSFIWRVPHHKSMIKNIFVAIVVWVCQIMVISFYINLDLEKALPKMIPTDYLLFILPLALNLGFMVQNTPVDQKG